MRAKLSLGEWELLSAYLDGQLSAQEKAALERQLQSRPELQDELEALRRTLSVLRKASRLRSPRNFTLKPSAAASRQRIVPRLFPALGFSSALALCLAVITFAVQMVPRLTPAMQAAPASVVEVQRSVEDSSVVTPSVPIINWGGVPAAPQGMGGGGGSGGAADNMGGIGGGPAQPPPPAQPIAPSMENVPQATAALPDLTTQAEATPGLLMEAAPAAAPTVAPAVPQATVLVEKSQAVTATPAATELAKAVPSGEAEGPILGIAPPEEQGKIMVPTVANTLEVPPPASAQVPAQASNGSSLWWLIPAGLATLGLILGIVAFIVWLTTRH